MCLVTVSTMSTRLLLLRIFFRNVHFDVDCCAIEIDQIRWISGKRGYFKVNLLIELCIDSNSAQYSVIFSARFHFNAVKVIQIIPDTHRPLAPCEWGARTLR